MLDRTCESCSDFGAEFCPQPKPVKRGREGLKLFAKVAGRMGLQLGVALGYAPPSVLPTPTLEQPVAERPGDHIERVRICASIPLVEVQIQACQRAHGAGELQDTV